MEYTNTPHPDQPESPPEPASVPTKKVIVYLQLAGIYEAEITVPADTDLSTPDAVSLAMHNDDATPWGSVWRMTLGDLWPGQQRFTDPDPHGDGRVWIMGTDEVD